MYEALCQELGNFLASTGRTISHPRASSAGIKEAEGALGFQIPLLLAEIYLTISNGGLGPGYGLIGVRDGHGSDLGTLVDAYRELHRKTDDMKPAFPDQLLPICEWGCGIFTCVDCGSEMQTLFRIEASDATPLEYSLEGFIREWMKGTDLFRAGTTRVTRTVINPFTRKPTTIHTLRPRVGNDAPREDA